MSGLRKIAFYSVLIGVLAVAAWMAFNFYQFKHASLLAHDQPPLVIELPKNKGTNYLIKALCDQQLLKHPWLWKTFASIRTLSHHLKAGEYEIKAGMSFERLLNHIVTGQVFVRQFTIIEGWTFHDLLQALQKTPYLRPVTQQYSEQQILTMLGAAQSQAEGLFYPDTYFYVRGDSDFIILQQSYAKMQQVLQQAWQERASNLLYQSPYDALIVASLIEKETALTAEKPLIAAVIINRLKKRMRLQIDPSVSYGLSQRCVYRSDLKKPTPYNTYLHFGLPPTPIALPSKSSIYAALHPALVDYLFYVSEGNGRHKFSNTYEAHLEAVKNYHRIQHDKFLKEQTIQQLIPVNF